MKFTEAKLEDVIIQLLEKQGYPHNIGSDIERGSRGNEEVLIKADLRALLASQYADGDITKSEIESIIRQLEAYSALDLYESNKQIMKRLADGFQLKREDYTKKDLYIYLVDYGETDNNHYKIVNQLEIQGHEN
ncbi:MAG: type I restriction endonuclease, partial [Gammaproteobacteria bacterium]|nr:type I restriction endonuclease [Gammaproteobacteria bacterium]